MEGCAFCTQPGHRLHKCDTAIEYLNSRLATYENGQIHLPNGRPVPNDGTRHGIKNGIDAWHASRPQTQNSASRPATPICDIPPHTSAHAATASWIKEVTESHVLQITNVAAYDDGSNSDDEPIDIFEVFTMGKRRREGKAAQVPELTQPVDTAACPPVALTSQTAPVQV